MHVMHTLGAGTGSKILRAAMNGDTRPASEIVGAQVVDQNPTWFSGNPTPQGLVDHLSGLVDARITDQTEFTTPSPPALEQPTSKVDLTTSDPGMLGIDEFGHVDPYVAPPITEEPPEVKPDTKSWDTKAGETIIKKAKEFAEDVGDVVSDNKADVINYIKEKRDQFKDFLNPSDQKKLDVIEKREEKKHQ